MRCCGLCIGGWVGGWVEEEETFNQPRLHTGHMVGTPALLEGEEEEER